MITGLLRKECVCPPMIKSMLEVCSANLISLIFSDLYLKPKCERQMTKSQFSFVFKYLAFELATLIGSIYLTPSQRLASTRPLSSIPIPKTPILIPSFLNI